MLTARDILYGEGKVYSALDIDPIAVQRLLWPDRRFPVFQQNIIYSIWDNDYTFVRAGNKLGKDYMGGFITPLFYLTRHPCRIVTTSAKEDHLRVLWGEMGDWINTCRAPLDYRNGGPLVIQHQNIYKLVEGQRCPLSYIRGMVAGDDSIAAMQGHHIKLTGDRIPRTMFVCDEASSVNHEYWRMARSWCNRAYIFGNPWPCHNFFYYSVKGEPNSPDKGGDILRDPRRPEKGYKRKLFRVRAEDSPNVRFGLAQAGATDWKDYEQKEAEGKLRKEPTDDILIPGVKPWGEYKDDRRTWDRIQQCVSLDGEFYEGAELRLFPPEWIKHSVALYHEWADKAKKKFGASDLLRIGGAHMVHPRSFLPGNTLQRRKARAGGGDTAQGGDSTALSAVDECGIMPNGLVSEKTPDTSVVTGKVAAWVHHWQFSWDRFVYDMGGGGKQHGDLMRARGQDVRMLYFNEASSANPRDMDDQQRQRSISESRKVFKNVRAEMFFALRKLMDPSLLTMNQFERAQVLQSFRGDGAPAVTEFYGWAIPDDTVALTEFVRQINCAIPLTYNEEGQQWVVPKYPKDRDDDKPNLVSICGCSPDELDAVILGIHGMLRPEVRAPFSLGSR